MIHGATLNGVINPKGFDSTVFFNYGTDINLGTIVQLPDIYNVNQETTVLLDITDLLPNTTYYFQVGLNYVDGQILGEILSFTTPAEVSIPTAVTLPATNVI
jgi:hypothetical protein